MIAHRTKWTLGLDSTCPKSITWNLLQSCLPLVCTMVLRQYPTRNRPNPRACLLDLLDPTWGIDTSLVCHQYTNVFELSRWSCSICSPGDSILVSDKHPIFSSLFALVLYTWSYLFISVWNNILTGNPLQSRSELVFSFLLVFCLKQASSRYQWSYNHVVFGQRSSCWQQKNGFIMNYM